MEAIRTMKGRAEYNQACIQHVDTKISIENRRIALRKEIQKIKRALIGMEKTQMTLNKELQTKEKIRKEIKEHPLFSPLPMAESVTTINLIAQKTPDLQSDHVINARTSGIHTAEIQTDDNNNSNKDSGSAQGKKYNRNDIRTTVLHKYVIVK